MGMGGYVVSEVCVGVGKLSRCVNVKPLSLTGIATQSQQKQVCSHVASKECLQEGVL